MLLAQARTNTSLRHNFSLVFCSSSHRHSCFWGGFGLSIGAILYTKSHKLKSGLPLQGKNREDIKGLEVEAAELVLAVVNYKIMETLIHNLVSLTLIKEVQLVLNLEIDDIIYRKRIIEIQTWLMLH